MATDYFPIIDNMNTDWIEFLEKNSAIQTESNQETETICALSNLAILKVSGKDSSQFLQGQLACNINDLTNNNSFFSVFCNAKGRAITTLLILKSEEGYLLVLPHQLIEKVSQKLRMYILRSDVQINDMSETHCLMGLTTNTPTLLTSLPETDFAVSQQPELAIKLPSLTSRYLIIATISQATSFWSQLTDKHNISPCSSQKWDYQDISAGIPWLTLTSSEVYIPQMLNIDKLGGISFNKGCYTGQEIIARTHYLGKAKRALFIAECDINTNVDTDTQLMIDETTSSNSQILSIQTNGQHKKLLIVMPTSDAELKNLTLNNSNQDKISIIDFQ